MANLTVDTPRTFYQKCQKFAVYPVAASLRIYEGAALGLDSNGNLVNLSGVSYPFVGFAVERVDNSSGAAEALFAKVCIEGDVDLDATGVSDHDDVGAVYTRAITTHSLSRPEPMFLSAESSNGFPALKPAFILPARRPVWVTTCRVLRP